MKTTQLKPQAVYRLRLLIVMLEIIIPFVLYQALQSGNQWLASICLVIVVVGMLGMVLIQ